MKYKWENNASFVGEKYTELWNTINSSDINSMYITGFGFDPRSLKSLEKIIQNKKIFDLLIIKNSSDTGIPDEFNDYNVLQTFVSDRKYQEIIKYLNQNIKNYSNIIIDISAMPRHLYLTLVHFIIKIIDQYNKSSSGDKINFYVTVLESPHIDGKIQSIIADGSDVEILNGFQSGYSSEGISNSSKVWFPVLGENEVERLKKIYDYVRPDEICPILPSPSKNPRRADELIKEYRELLFDTWGVETSNFIYATEDNPFDIYMKILESSKYYKDVFSLMNNCRIIISTFSSKVISIGALLAANDLQRNNYDVSIIHVKSSSYTNGNGKSDTKLESAEFTAIQIEGELYEY